MKSLDIEHRVTVARLRELLADPGLRDDDLLVPNQVQNLLIERDGQPIGVVDLLWFDTHVVIYEPDAIDDEEG